MTRVSGQADRAGSCIRNRGTGRVRLLILVERTDSRDGLAVATRRFPQTVYWVGETVTTTSRPARLNRQARSNAWCLWCWLNWEIHSNKSLRNRIPERIWPSCQNLNWETNCSLISSVSMTKFLRSMSIVTIWALPKHCLRCELAIPASVSGNGYSVATEGMISSRLFKKMPTWQA